MAASRPGTREPDRRGPEGRDLEEGVGRRQLLVARDLGDQRLVGGVEELLDARVDEDGDEQQRDVDAEQERDRRDDDGLEQVARHHDLAPVPAVHEHAGDEPDDQAGDRGGHEGHAHEERGPGLVVDVDAGGEVRQGGAGGRHQLRHPHQDEVALLEHRGRRDARRHCLVRRSRRGLRRRPGHPLPHGSSQSLHAPASRSPSGTRGLARSVRPRTASIRALPHTEDWCSTRRLPGGRWRAACCSRVSTSTPWTRASPACASAASAGTRRCSTRAIPATRCT